MLNIGRRTSTHRQPEYSLDRLKVEQTVVTERYCRDSGQWDKMRAFWHSDDSKTRIKITWFNGTIEGHINGSKDMAEKGGLQAVKHLINPVDVTISGDRALCEAYGSINARPTFGGVEYDSSSLATFLFKLVRIEGEWKIVSLECVYDKDNFVPVVGGAVPTPLDIKFPRASYRCLGYILNLLGGYDIDLNLPGYDRPEEAQRFLQLSREWIYQKHPNY